MQVTFMDNISWLLSNLCQRNPPLNLELIKPILPVFDRLLNSENENMICKIFVIYRFFMYILYPLWKNIIRFVQNYLNGYCTIFKLNE